MGPAFSLATTMGPMIAAAGALAPAALLLLTVVMAAIAIAFARLLRVLPNAGSSYSWIRHAFGVRVGGYGAWLLILANFFAVLATALPAGAYTLDLIAPGLSSSPLPVALLGSLWTIASSVVLWRGMRPTSTVAMLLLAGELAVLAITAIAAFLHPLAAAAGAHPRMPAMSWGGVVVAMVLGVWMTDGWEVAASASEESRGGRETPGSAGLIALCVTSALLYLCMSAYMRVGTLDGFSAHAEDALAYVGVQLGAGIWSPAISVTVLVSLGASLQTTMVYLSRSVFAMGRDGTLPAALGRLDARAEPSLAILAVTLLVLIFIMATGLWRSALDAYTLVLNGSAVFLGALFMLSSAAAVRIFAGERSERLGGVVIPLAGTVALAAILVVAVAQSDVPTREFIVAGALAGFPFAAWHRDS
jgi:amino acid transporter